MLVNEGFGETGEEVKRREISTEAKQEAGKAAIANTLAMIQRRLLAACMVCYVEVKQA